jgi:pimeloyl-ACP methyl ester carboxylesterase
MDLLRKLAAGLIVLLAFSGVGDASSPLHRDVLVFVPAYEGSQLFDTELEDKGDPVCVWGCYDTFLTSERYFAMRLPNPLVAKPMLNVGPIDVYGNFISTMTAAQPNEPGFSPYTEDADFFTFFYDWRQDIASDSAPKLGQALDGYAKVHEKLTGIPAEKTRFIIVAHSMGGLVARTLLSERPEMAKRMARLYLVGTPNAGSVKATRTLVVGPDSIDQFAHGFPAGVLGILPTDVDHNVTKLVGITRPSLYELLPMDDPHWTAVQPSGERRKMAAEDVLFSDSWSPYWPSAGLEKRLFIDGWLKNRAAKLGKVINPAAWYYCQDPGYEKLKAVLAQVRLWRKIMGRLSDTDRKLTADGEKSRLRVVVSTGLQTPTGVVTQGLHDAATADYIYGNEGDGTVEQSRVFDDMKESSLRGQTLHGVPHGRLMIDPQFLGYFTKELSGQPLAK